MNEISQIPSAKQARSIDLHPLRVTLHQGHQSIGGALFEVSHRCGNRIILDLGLPLYESRTQEALNLDWARLARDPAAGLVQLRRLGIPPPGLGLLQDELPRLCGAIFITHAHLDHWGLLPFVRDGLRVYCHPVTQRLILWQCLWQGIALPRLDWHAVNPGDWVRPVQSRPSSEFRVEVIGVEHSVPGALALRVCAGGRENGRVIVYSGDLRFDREPEAQIKDAWKLSMRTDLLLVEGTHLGQAASGVLGPDEAEVGAAVQRALMAHRGLVTVQASALHQQRLAYLSRAARQAGRTLVLDLYAALTHLAAGGHLRGVRVLFTKDYMRRIEQRRRQFPDLAKRFMGQDDLQTCESRRVRLQEIQDEPGAWLLGLRAGMLKDLERYASKGWARLPKPELHLHSLWKGYRRFGDTLEVRLRAQGVPVQDADVHASGHATADQLRRWAANVGAEQTVAVHSAHPECLSKTARPALTFNSRRRARAMECFGRRGFTLRDWVGEQVKVFGKDPTVVKTLALRRGFLDEEVDGALVCQGINL
jgi:ribonuclease J